MELEPKKFIFSRRFLQTSSLEKLLNPELIDCRPILVLEPTDPFRVSQRNQRENNFISNQGCY